MCPSGQPDKQALRAQRVTHLPLVLQFPNQHRLSSTGAWGRMSPDTRVFVIVAITFRAKWIKPGP